MGDDPRGMGRQVDAVGWTAGSDEVRALLPLPPPACLSAPSPRLIPTDSGWSQSPCGRIGLPGGPAERPSPRISLPPLQSVSLPRLPPSPSRRPCPQAETALERAVGELLRTRKVHGDLACAVSTSANSCHRSLFTMALAATLYIILYARPLLNPSAVEARCMYLL